MEADEFSRNNVWQEVLRWHCNHCLYISTATLSSQGNKLIDERMNYS